MIEFFCNFVGDYCIGIMIFSFQLTEFEILLLGATLFCVLFLVVFYCRRIASVARFQKDNCVTPEGLSGVALPSASVIVYAQDDADALARLLPTLLTQDYNAQFEVIVVNDGADEAVNEIVEKMQLHYNNLYLTFTPNEARNLSRKKLALTIGIKAARNEVVVLTCADAVVGSSDWLFLMCRNFKPGIEVVVGYAYMDACRDKGRGARRRAFDSAMTAIVYLSAAIARRPYRANGYNLAYRRDTFFKNKGFSNSLNLHYGDDDIFVDRITNRTNTAVELSPDAIVKIDCYDDKSMYKELKMRDLFNSRFISRRSSRLFGLFSFLFWVWFGLSVVAIFFTLPNLFPSIVVLVLALLLWVMTLFVWRKVLCALCSRRLLFTIPYFIMTQPIYNLIYRLRSRRFRERNYTWH